MSHLPVKPARSWAPVVLWGIGALWFTSAAVNAMFGGMGNSFDSTMVNGEDVFNGCQRLIGAVVCFSIAVRCEHRIRGPRPDRAGSRVEYVRASASALASGIVLTLLGAGFAFTAFHAYPEVARSSYTQAHGLTEDAKLLSVTSDGEYCASTSCVAHVYVSAVLEHPVSGHTHTTLYITDGASPAQGIAQQLNQDPGGVITTVHIDPDDPGYAELPQWPYETDTPLVTMAVLAAIAFMLGVTGIVRGFPRSRRRPGHVRGRSSKTVDNTRHMPRESDEL